MTITIDASTLLSYYQAKAGITTSGSSSSSSTGATSTSTVAPTPPWSSTSTAPQQSALVTSVMAGSRFINPNAAQLNVQSGTNATDYKNLFALYSGVSALQGIATAASAANLSAADLATYQSRFAAGLKEVDSFLASAPFTGFTVAQGQVAASQTSTVTVPHQNTNYQTAPIFTGSLNDPVPAFAGAVQFSLQLTKPSGSATTVNFDLSEMGDTPRTMPNVVNYLNSKLQDAGVSTRFANVRIPATPTTVKSGTSTITLPAGSDSFALQIVGTSAEIPTFTAATSDPGVYVTSTSGRTAAQATTALPADSTIQVAKFDGGQSVTTEADGTTKIAGHTLPANVAAVRSTATAPDGSLYVLADLTGPAPDGEPIQGAQDVALLKYDSAGNLQFSRTLGASDSASGYALAVSPDGKSVAVAGTSQSALDGANGTTIINSATTNTFTTVFSSAGDEQWTTQRTGSVGDQPTAVTFGPDGSVYVVGKTGGSVQGGAAVGGGDAWLQGFSKTGAPTYTSEIGTTSADKAAGVVADASGVVVAAVENGHAVLQRYDFDANGALQQGASTDLGDLQGGDIAGLGQAADGSLVLAGSTHNGALAAPGATVNSAYSSGREAFVANIASALQPSASNTLNYVDLGADATTSGLTVSGGQAYITGQLSQPNGVLQGYAAAVDPTTGALGWHDTINGADGLDAPSSIAVSQGGASVLDRLGLPNGTITYSGATSSAAADGSLTLSGPGSTLVAATSVRAGDQFLVRSGTGAAVPVTIDATDTLNTLATKINRALAFTGKAEVVPVSGGYQLKISPANTHTTIQIEAGPAGKNALSALGLSEGLILNQDSTSSTSTSSTSSTASTSSATALKTYGLKLPSTLSIASPTAAKQAAVLLGSAETTLTLAYSDLAFPSSSSTSSTKPGNNTPLSASEQAYYSARLSDYQLALAKLTGTG